MAEFNPIPSTVARVLPRAEKLVAEAHIVAITRPRADHPRCRRAITGA
jgi:hypothetical protein